MDLIGRLRAWALGSPRALVVDAPGSRPLRWTVEAELDRRGWARALSPSDADVLLVTGTPGPELAAAVDLVWRQMPRPRHRVALLSEGDVEERFAAAVRELATAAEQADETAGDVDSEQARSPRGVPMDHSRHEATAAVSAVEHSDHGAMAGMDHSGHGAMAGMDDPGHEGMDHSGHEGMGNSGREGMDHSGHEGMGDSGHGAMAGMDHSGHEGTDHSGHEGMDHSGHEGMDHSGHEGMDHSGHEGMDHSGHEGMDHSGHGGMDHSGHGDMGDSGHGAMAGMDHSGHGGMDHSGHGDMGDSGHGAMAGMDHSGHGGMDHSGHGDMGDSGHGAMAGMDHSGMGGGDHSGHHMHHGGDVAGLPMAETAPDRDGLTLDVLRVSVGPVLTDWPTGLLLRAELQGDVVTGAQLTWLDDGHQADPDPGADPRRTALDHLASLLSVAGWHTAARDVRRARAGLASPDPGARAAAEQRAQRVVRRVRRSRALAWSLRGIGRVDGRIPGTQGDVLDRLRRWCDAVSDTAAMPAPGVSLDDVAMLLQGAEVAAARLIVASVELQRSVAHAEPEVVGA